MINSRAWDVRFLPRADEPAHGTVELLTLRAAREATE
ncbi:hypothetical protein SAMN04489730_1109 [Amycolatopsis australiensis]|uniref:Uncharacterized protein n=1 Tax=Amycolatopsis australiensis TaxID=546364 RepID=A0A1K1PWV6_9PSEU|nr:hypothetical protein SAMN04489730_1109 [Amycolatopsis australiensis]